MGHLPAAAVSSALFSSRFRAPAAPPPWSAGAEELRASARATLIPLRLPACQSARLLGQNDVAVGDDEDADAGVAVLSLSKRARMSSTLASCAARLKERPLSPALLTKNILMKIYKLNYSVKLR